MRILLKLSLAQCYVCVTFNCRWVLHWKAFLGLPLLSLQICCGPWQSSGVWKGCRVGGMAAAAKWGNGLVFFLLYFRYGLLNAIGTSRGEVEVPILSSYLPGLAEPRKGALLLQLHDTAPSLPLAAAHTHVRGTKSAAFAFTGPSWCVTAGRNCRLNVVGYAKNIGSGSAICISKPLHIPTYDHTKTKCLHLRDF
jgi:hypothetical protein